MALYFVALATIGGQLFFPDQLASATHGFGLFQARTQVNQDQVVIAYSSIPKQLDPTLFDPLTRSYLADVYEGLVRTDRNLKIESGLAVSWGLLDPLTWEFRLRPQVTFHNGQALNQQDVLFSFDRARKSKNSQLKDLLNTIQSVEAKDEDKIVIHTKVPDPLLLNKLSLTYVFPKDYKTFEVPMGTGPYQFERKTSDTMTLQRFDSYYGQKPIYKQVMLKAIEDPDKRVEALKAGEVQLLANLPPSSACSADDAAKNPGQCHAIGDPNLLVKSVPSLEVSFLVFNQANPFFKDVAVRKALMQAFDAQVFVDQAFGFARTVGQFVSSGVFGFNPEIQKMGYDMEAAKMAVDKALAGRFEQLSLTFDYPDSLEAVGSYVKTQLTDLGLDVTLNPLSQADLQKKISSGTSDFYFLGWRSELGDASDFLQAVGHSKDLGNGYGLFNGSHATDKKVDELISASQQNLDAEKRLQQLQQVMKLLVQDDVMGVPLFEADLIFAFSNKFDFTPRLDGYIHAAEIKARS